MSVEYVVRLKHGAVDAAVVHHVRRVAEAVLHHAEHEHQVDEPGGNLCRHLIAIVLEYLYQSVKLDEAISLEQASQLHHGRVETPLLVLYFGEHEQIDGHVNC